MKIELQTAAGRQNYKQSNSQRLVIGRRLTFSAHCVHRTWNSQWNSQMKKKKNLLQSSLIGGVYNVVVDTVCPCHFSLLFCLSFFPLCEQINRDIVQSSVEYFNFNFSLYKMIHERTHNLFTTNAFKLKLLFLPLHLHLSHSLSVALSSEKFPQSVSFGCDFSQDLCRCTLYIASITFISI